MSKIISIIGGNGYVGMRCIKTLLKNYRDIKVYAICRTPKLDYLRKFDDRVEFIKGDALNADLFSSYIEKSDGVIHAVGKLIAGSPEEYDTINYQTAINVARIANNYSPKKNFVYISAERGFPFPLSIKLSGYIDSKRKAEEALIKDFPNINPIILRPGVINDMTQRPFVVPISMAFNFGNFIEKNVINKIIPDIGEKIGIPAASIELDTLCLYATEGSLGKLKDKIYSNDKMNNLDNLKQINLKI